MTAKEELHTIVQAWHGEFCMGCDDHTAEVNDEVESLYQRIRNGE